MNNKFDIQLFAEEETENETDNNENDETTEEETTETEDNNETTEEKKSNGTSYVKIREEKARQKLLKELGVKDVAEAKRKLSQADDAISRVKAIEERLEAEDTEKVYSKKVNELTKILEHENVFDADALINYVDLDSFDLKNGKIDINEAKEIVKSLKELKPHYFGKNFIKTDSYKKNQGQENQENDYQADYDAGNYTAVIAKFLKNSKK